jgi:hypothetical protein
MPNRIIKESICTSDNLDSCSYKAEVLFYRILVNCDDYGRMDARISVLKSRCFPLRIDSLPNEDITKWLSELVEADLVFTYSCDGIDRNYLQVKTWENHQQIRARRSKYPEPDSNGNHLLSDVIKCPRNPIQSNPNTNPNTITRINIEFFDAFWKAYPRKMSKGQAERAFVKVNPDEQLLATMLAKIERAKTSGLWADGNKRFIPYPATWLNSKGWEDEIPEGGVDGAHQSNTEQAKPARRFSAERLEASVHPSKR